MVLHADLCTCCLFTGRSICFGDPTVRFFCELERPSLFEPFLGAPFTARE